MSSSEEIDISGLDKAVLLLELWKNQRTASFFEASGTPSPSPPTYEQAQKAANGGVIDYFQGRAIKMNLQVNSIDPRLYERYAGTGSFLRIVQSLRRKEKEKEKEKAQE